MSGGQGPAEEPGRGWTERASGTFREKQRPAGEDAILRTVPRGDARSAEAAPTQSPVPDGTSQDQREPGTMSGDGRYRGWLPGSERLTPGEFFAGCFTAGVVWLVLSAALAFAGSWIQLPAPLAGNEAFSSVLGGLIVGVYVSIHLRSSRLARRKHLRGER